MISFSEDLNNEMQHLYIITTIFNPAGYKKRYDLYYKFEEHLQKFGINLVTIECIYDCFPNSKYEVTHSDNPLHIQVKTDHPLWHKENLINIAISRLPNDWKYVLWLDADIEFLDEDWPMRIKNAFEKYDIIQVFKYSHFLGPDGDVLETHFSFTYAIVEGIPIDKRYYHLFYPHPGYGWGMTRQAYDELNGLVDFGILGSGDAHMAFSFINKVHISLSFPTQDFNPNFLVSLQQWKKKAYQYTLNGKVGYADCVIQHYFHGYREDRQYVNRMSLLINNNFDPVNDLFYDTNGLLQLKPEKQQLQKEIITYFLFRNEDKSGKDEKGIHANIFPRRSVDELLFNATQIQELVEEEEFEDAMDNIYEPMEETRKRSSSYNDKRKKKRRAQREKKIELVFELRTDDENGNSLSNSTISDSDSNSSCIHSLSGVSNNVFSPNRSVNLNCKSESLMYHCGICYSSSQKSHHAYSSKNQGGSKKKYHGGSGHDHYVSNSPNYY